VSLVQICGEYLTMDVFARLIRRIEREPTPCDPAFGGPVFSHCFQRALEQSISWTSFTSQSTSSSSLRNTVERQKFSSLSQNN